MTKLQLTKAPFRADHVGSFLRPKALQKARQEFKDGRISKEQLRQVENKEIAKLVDKQIEVGLKAVTDGEFRRDWWHIDFLEQLNGIEGYVPEEGYKFQGVEVEKYDIRCVGKISWNPNHSFIQDFKDFKEIVAGRAIPKQTIPSPNMLFAGVYRPEIHPDIEEYANDIIVAYREAIKDFYEAGVRYLQLDDVYIAGLSSPDFQYDDRQYFIDLALRIVNEVLEDKPEDLVVTTHLCRGNYKSSWSFSGGYDWIAPTLFAKEKVDGFFLEYDDERSGDFKPLQYIPRNGARVVLGLFTSKKGELEDKDEILRRINEATEYIPLEQLAISTQCGFSSTHHGNILTEEEQWQKLKFIVEIAKEVWGEI